MLYTFLAATTIAVISLLFWSAHPLFLPLGWGIIIAVAIWDWRHRTRV